MVKISPSGFRLYCVSGECCFRLYIFLTEPSLNPIPKHVGVILDGNRRLAKRLMLKPWKGHELGYEKVKSLFGWCKEFGVMELTLYAFSIENFDRTKEEFDYLMNLFNKAFSALKKDPNVKDIKICFIGRVDMFPKSVKSPMYELMDETKNNGPYTVNFAMAYGGRAEIVDATKKIAEQVKSGKLNIDQINEDVFKHNLYMEDEPDLVIRTSESRLSGFLTYQCVYAELIFLPDKLWPEFSKEDFSNCLKEYSNRKRRFGQ